MKKLGKYLVMAGLAAALSVAPMTSYAGIWENAKKDSAQTETVAYEFKSGDTVIAMGAEAATVVKALGKPAKAVFEADSCAYQGKDKVYTYAGFELNTYPVDGKERIASVYFLDDSVATPEGIKIGSKAKDVVDAYGKEYNKEEQKLGTYSYSTDTAELRIYTTKDVVDGVEYLVKAAK